MSRAPGQGAGPGPHDPLLDGQLRYYDARASEYDQWFLRTQRLARHATELTAVDASQSMLDVARVRPGAENARFVPDELQRCLETLGWSARCGSTATYFFHGVGRRA